MILGVTTLICMGLHCILLFDKSMILLHKTKHIMLTGIWQINQYLKRYLKVRRQLRRPYGISLWKDLQNMLL